jgi:hypothetical protein
VVAALLPLLACRPPSGPQADTGKYLTGIWETPGIPSGGLTSLSLQASGGRVTGSGRQWGLLRCFVDSFTVSGNYASSGGFDLTLAFARGSTGSFVGQIFLADSLQGVWTSIYFGTYPQTLLPVSHEYATNVIQPCAHPVRDG